MHDAVAVPVGYCWIRYGIRRSRPDVQVNDVPVVPVDERSNRPAVDIVEPPANQREAPCREILDRWGEIDATVEPWLNRMLVGRDDIFEMARLQRPYMRGNQLLGQILLGRGQNQKGQRSGAGDADAEANRRLARGAEARQDCRRRWHLAPAFGRPEDGR